MYFSRLLRTASPAEYSSVHRAKYNRSARPVNAFRVGSPDLVPEIARGSLLHRSDFRQDALFRLLDLPPERLGLLEPD